MIRSMLAAVSGMRNHQTFLDVIGNNIANVNTIGFKSGRVLFSDIMSQLAHGASSPQQGRGGINPLQIGLGMQVGGVDTIQTQGNFQSTGKFTDLAIEGDGFFITNDGTRNFYTRDGSFDLAVDGTIVSPVTGMKVQGWLADSTGAIDTSRPLGAITIPFGAAMSGQPSSIVTARGNLDQDTNQLGYGTVTQSRASGGTGTAGGAYSGSSTASYVVRIASISATNPGEVTGIEVSTDGGTTYGAPIATSGGAAVSIGNGMTFAIATSTSNQANDTYSFAATPPTVVSNVSVYDSLGALHSIQLTFTKTGTNTWTWLPSTTESGLSITSPTSATLLNFSTTGAYVGQQPAGSMVIHPTNGANDITVSLDLNKLTQLAGTSEAQSSADGAPAGSLVSFAIGQAGDVTGVYTNGLSKLLGQIALAKFANPGGLLKSGKNLYELTSNSGDPTVGAPGSGGRGQISSGYLEMSNVDLALQFTNMIMAERGFQANSRVITASDEMLQDLVNLKR
ncbi:MAG: flagellar hook protein FlgE [Chloroflexi bacterium]|nr:flagellar hook protein FlgE [Chloroflexota bacterium]